MRFPAAGLLIVLVTACGLTACGRPVRQYEYEEQLYLSVNGSATVILNASIPSLTTLRGLPLDPAPAARLGRDDVRRVFEAAGCQVVRVGRLWRRNGRRFAQIRISAEHVRDLARCTALGWSTFEFQEDEAGFRYLQRVGAPTGGPTGPVNWTGQEIVAFRLHLPSRILNHNVRRLEDGTAGEAERGNILTYEQLLTDRRAGKPLVLDVRLETQPIFYRTLWLFGGSFAAAVAALVLIVWLVVRRGKRLRSGA